MAEVRSGRHLPPEPPLPHPPSVSGPRQLLPKGGGELGFRQGGAVGAGRQVPDPAGYFFHPGQGRGWRWAAWRPTPLALPGLGDQKPILSPHLPRATSSSGRTQGIGPGCFALRSQGKLAEQGLVGLGPPGGTVESPGNAEVSPFGF